MSVTVRINTTAVKAAVRDGAKDGLRVEVDGWLQASRALVPVDLGDLRDSGYYTEPEDVGSAIESKIGYDTDYALYVHEVKMRHPNGGQAKYLEAAINERANGAAERIGARIAARLGR